MEEKANAARRNGRPRIAALCDWHVTAQGLEGPGSYEGSVCLDSCIEPSPQVLERVRLGYNLLLGFRVRFRVHLKVARQVTLEGSLPGVLHPLEHHVVAVHQHGRRVYLACLKHKLCHK